MFGLVLLAGAAAASECLYEAGICNPFNSWIDVGNDGDGYYNQYSTVCECQDTTEVCTTYYDSLLCEKGQFTASDVWLVQTDSPCCGGTTEEPQEPGCCYGTVAKCDTDERAVCQKASKCEWRSGEDADCTVTTPAPEPGCCYGSDDMCDTDDATTCDKRARRYGCEWIAGEDADCTIVSIPPISGCCYGSSSRCDTDDESTCNRFADRHNCEWRSGETADCSTPEPTEPEPGCCYGADERCDTDDEATCEKRARRYGCEWITGEDADCTGVSIQPISTAPGVSIQPISGCCAGTSRRCNTDDESTCKRSSRQGCEWRSDGMCDDDEVVMAVMEGADVEPMATRERISVDGLVLLASAITIAVAAHRWCFSAEAKLWARESQPLLAV